MRRSAYSMNNFLEYLLSLELNQIEHRKQFFLKSLIRETNYKQRFDTLELYNLCQSALSTKKEIGSSTEYKNSINSS